MSQNGCSKKIVFVANEIGGFRNHRGNLVKAMNALGYEAIVYASPVGSAEGLTCTFRSLTIERFRLHLKLDFQLFWTVLTTLLHEKPQVLHLISIKPYLFGGLAAFCARVLGWRGRTVITVPGLGRLYSPEAFRLGLTQFRRLFVEALLRVATRGGEVTFETHHDRDVWLERGLVDLCQAHVINGAGVDFALFSPPERATSQPHRLRVLFAGRLLRQKGLPVFMKAASILRRSGMAEKIEMLVAGPTEEDPGAVPLNALQKCEGLRFIGYVRDMASLLRDVDVVVLPSCYNEGIPRILLEAAAMGCVSIASNFPGSRALIQNMETGILLEMQNEDALSAELAAWILRVQEHPIWREEMGRNAAEFVRTGGVGIEDVARAFLAVYALDLQNSSKVAPIIMPNDACAIDDVVPLQV